MAIASLYNGESGSSVRTKLNQVISRINAIENISSVIDTEQGGTSWRDAVALTAPQLAVLNAFVIDGSRIYTPYAFRPGLFSTENAPTDSIFIDVDTDHAMRKHADDEIHILCGVGVGTYAGGGTGYEYADPLVKAVSVDGTYPTVTGGILAGDVLLLIQHDSDKETSDLPFSGGNVVVPSGFSLLMMVKEYATPDHSGVGIAFFKEMEGGESGPLPTLTWTSELVIAILIRDGVPYITGCTFDAKSTSVDTDASFAGDGVTLEGWEGGGLSNRYKPVLVGIGSTFTDTEFGESNINSFEYVSRYKAASAGGGAISPKVWERGSVMTFDSFVNLGTTSLVNASEAHGPITEASVTVSDAVAYTFALRGKIVVADPDTVDDPLFSPAASSGNSGTVSVTISTTTSGATIRYTVDGGIPSSTVGTVYTGPVELTETTTLRAIAYVGSVESAVTSGTYGFDTGEVDLWNPVLMNNVGRFNQTNAYLYTDHGMFQLVSGWKGGDSVAGQYKISTTFYSLSRQPGDIYLLFVFEGYVTESESFVLDERWELVGQYANTISNGDTRSLRVYAYQVQTASESLPTVSIGTTHASYEIYRLRGFDYHSLINDMFFIEQPFIQGEDGVQIAPHVDDSQHVLIHAVQADQIDYYSNAEIVYDLNITGTDHQTSVFRNSDWVDHVVAAQLFPSSLPARQLNMQYSVKATQNNRAECAELSFELTSTVDSGDEGSLLVAPTGGTGAPYFHSTAHARTSRKMVLVIAGDNGGGDMNGWKTTLNSAGWTELATVGSGNRQIRAYGKTIADYSTVTGTMIANIPTLYWSLFDINSDIDVETLTHLRFNQVTWSPTFNTMERIPLLPFDTSFSLAKSFAVFTLESGDYQTIQEVQDSEDNKGCWPTSEISLSTGQTHGRAHYSTLHWSGIPTGPQLELSYRVAADANAGEQTPVMAVLICGYRKP